MVRSDVMFRAKEVDDSVGHLISGVIIAASRQHGRRTLLRQAAIDYQVQ